METAKSGLGRVVERIHNFVSRKSLPNERYESLVLVYGGEFVKDPDGKMVFDLRRVKPNIVSGLQTIFDIEGDEKVRAFDDHVKKIKHI